MGNIGDLSTLLTQAYKIWQDARGKASVTPQELYDKYIEPSYQLLKLVHANYLETYLELEERIALEPSLSEATVRWFARARTKMQADRSELRLVGVPQAAGKSEAVNSKATAYIVAVHEYFPTSPPQRITFASAGDEQS